MTSYPASFDEPRVLHELKHFLPAQAPLKDFIHHNPLHAFQSLTFYQGIGRASEIFGYNVSLTLAEYRARYEAGQIRRDILASVIARRQGAEALTLWTDKVLLQEYTKSSVPRIGQLRASWKKHYHLDLDSLVHPGLFRLLCSYLDQGIAIWRFPVRNQGFLAALQELERHSFASFFRTPRARDLLLNGTCQLPDLLHLLVGDVGLYEQYLFDQQFAHQGWSGMVSVIEDQPQSLLDHRPICLRELIVVELLLEIDALDFRFGKAWAPLHTRVVKRPPPLFAPVPHTELREVLAIWQDAFEWSYYDAVLAGIRQERVKEQAVTQQSFQALFCIDDRECSLRRYLEQFDPGCATYGTPGFFGVEFFFQPQDGQFYEKVCPAPLTPTFLVKEVGARRKREKDAHFSKHAHSWHSGWLISQALGFWSAFQLAASIFRPTMSPAAASSFRHMGEFSRLTIENKSAADRENGLQIGFTVPEMAQRVEALLLSIGLVRDFAPLVYVVGHGSSSANNPHYAAYDCGACSGRAGSVNSRVLSYMANHAEVRTLLRARGIHIPDSTRFVGGLHDTTRDDIAFFDLDLLPPVPTQSHQKNAAVFGKALDYNAKERSRRFESIDSKRSPEQIHEQVRTRSVSLFEPRPELNHATNALCIVGRRSLSKGLFLDRRAFLNSYDYRLDPEGQYLLSILKAAAPVCGGINLEYFFSRVDNQKLGAGTKLPHNVMGLFGVANGIDGDLRPGLPSQMIEVHDPVRMLFVVEHFPEVVLQTIQASAPTYEWFRNEWVHLVAVHPATRELSVFKNGAFAPYQPTAQPIEAIAELSPLVEAHQENMPVYLLA